MPHGARSIPRINARPPPGSGRAKIRASAGCVGRSVPRAQGVSAGLIEIKACADALQVLIDQVMVRNPVLFDLR